jgi:glycosyltransferase involved in cell wall biosynthesis
VRIGIITDGIDNGSAGIGTYIRGLMSGLRELGREDDVTYVHRGAHESYGNGRQLIYSGAANKIVRKQLQLPLALRRFDLVHDTYHAPPFLMPAGYARVMTIHDMAPFVLGRGSMQLGSWLWHRAALPVLARRADHIVTDSHHTRADVIRILGVAPERVSTAHLAASQSFRPQPDEQAAEARRRYGLPQRFLLYLGTIEPRKNLVRVVRAFERAAVLMPDVDLVLAGGLSWQADDVRTAVRCSPYRGRIHMPGRIDGDDLAALYSAAVATVYVSLYEGFGLPPLEAMQSGCPVIASNASSIPEVVGDAALLVDSRSEAQIADAMCRVATEPECARALRERGLERAQRFSWRRCAEATLAAYDAACGIAPERRLEAAA